MEEEIQISQVQVIKEHYLKIVLTEREIVSVYDFCERIGISEEEFYSFFNSLEALESAIWKDFIDEVLQILNEDDTYPEYSAREKTLAFFYTFFEDMKSNRSFVLMRLSNFEYKTLSFPKFLKEFNRAFNLYAKDIVEYAHSTGEIAQLPFISSQYSHLFNVNMMYLLKVWIQDESENYQVTDAAIEKTVNLMFEILEGGVVENLIDFVKFAYQNKAY